MNLPKFDKYGQIIFCLYYRLPNKRTSRNKSIGWNFSQNLIKVQEGDEPNNSIARVFLT